KLENAHRLTEISNLHAAAAAASFNNPLSKAKVAELTSEIESRSAVLLSEYQVAMKSAAYKSEMQYGQYAANRAVASRYYSHDLVQSRGSQYDARMQAELAKGYFNQKNTGQFMSDAVFAVPATII